MKTYKSINSYGSFVQQQIKQVLAAPQFQGRLALCQSEGLQWHKFSCIVPLTMMEQAENLASIIILVRFHNQFNLVSPGIYIESNFIPQRFWFINLTDETIDFQDQPQTAEKLLVDLLSKIDSQGFIKWAKKVYQGYFTYNKLDEKQISLVNLIKNNLIQTKQNKICQNIFGQNSCQLSKYQKKQQSHNQISLSQYAKYDNEIKLQQDLQLIKKQTNGLKNQDIMHLLINGNSQLNYLKDQHYKFQQEKSQNKAQDRLCKQQNRFFDATKILASPFSSFKPIALSRDSHSDMKNIRNSLNKNEQQFKVGNFGFVPYQPNIQINNYVKSVVKSQQDNLNENSFFINLNLNLKCQDINYVQKSQTQLSEDIKNENKRISKHPKHPKPMNKNANLPKFLIRIFIKYVDRFKTSYIKKQFDKLYAQCKKMKQWKKNDRRQHAFGLKHLKNFFQDSTDGYPSAGHNRKIISKIINNYLLQQICQNSQIPQSHRVGYLIACRVYSIRCRNAFLAGRIQSK